MLQSDLLHVDFQADIELTAFNPEQRASLASEFFYSFLDPTILKAYRGPHLPADELPSLCDYDEAKNLKKRSQPVSMANL